MSPAHAAEDAASRHRWAFIDGRAGLWYEVCSQSDLLRSFEMPDLCHSQRDRTHYMPVDMGAVETSRMRHNVGAVVRSLSASGVTKDVVAVVKVSYVLQGQRSQASRVGNGGNVRESRRARLAKGRRSRATFARTCHGHSITTEGIAGAPLPDIARPAARIK